MLIEQMLPVTTTGAVTAKIHEDYVHDVLVAMGEIEYDQSYSREDIVAIASGDNAGKVMMFCGMHQVLNYLARPVLVDLARLATGDLAVERTAYKRDERLEITEAEKFNVDRLAAMSDRQLRIEIIRAWHRKGRQ